MSFMRATVLGLPITVSLSLAHVAPLHAGPTDVTIFDPFIPTIPTAPVSPVSPGTPVTPVTETVTPEATAYVSNGIREAYALCSSLDEKAYTVDCLRERIETLANQMPDSGAYADAKEVLEDAAEQLGGVVRRTRSVTRPPARIQAVVNGTPVVTSPLIPVREEQVQDALAEAVGILEEAETKLLRSGTGSADRQTAYQTMAAAVGSNKVLLRAS